MYAGQCVHVKAREKPPVSVLMEAVQIFFKRLGLLVGSCWVVEADWLVSQRDPLVSDFPRTPAANSCHGSWLFMGVLGLELRTSYL